jgi:16S rRNA (adenine1518-N6/adenine1519-N6)-dimethyltransferase
VTCSRPRAPRQARRATAFMVVRSGATVLLPRRESSATECRPPRYARGRIARSSPSPPNVGNGISGGGATPKLPKGAFSPKQSLGQNYLSDQNYVLKIVNALCDGPDQPATDEVQCIAAADDGSRVLELGPGAGALSHVLLERYPSMMAIELDRRAVALLAERLPTLAVLESDVLQVDYASLASIRGGSLLVVGNLPYYITSQILFSFVDCAPAVRRAVVTMQWEVAQRLVASPGTKEYGILSVVFQLYAKPRVNFKIPPTVFYPRPKVDSALVTIDFMPSREPFNVSARDLRRVITAAFQQRRKMLRQSLKEILKGSNLGLPDEWGTRRPENLEPSEFLTLTALIFGARAERQDGETRVWRHARHGGEEAA